MLPTVHYDILPLLATLPANKRGGAYQFQYTVYRTMCGRISPHFQPIGQEHISLRALPTLQCVGHCWPKANKWKRKSKSVHMPIHAALHSVFL
jgi:hypothetical protein